MISGALQSMHRTLRLVDQIMEVNSLESGQVPLDPEPFKLAPVASDLLYSLITLAAEKNIQLNNDIPTDLPEVLADPDLIARVLQNLVGNALKFTHEGGEIRLSALQLENHVTIYVSDTGPGLAAEVREDPFAKFAVGPNKGRGSGLGLAFCKMVIEAHDQKIWVDDSSEDGTTFAFSLPIANDDGVAIEPTSAHNREETIS
jgi:signal transduction histidine kinase